jgi:ribokinase
MNSRRVVVFGPAYLDRVLRVDRSLIADEQEPPIDQSVEGEWKFADRGTIAVISPDRSVIEIVPPPGWPGPWGEVRLRRSLPVGANRRHSVRGIAWLDDLGGMGAGFAAAMDGSLHSAVGPESDTTSRAVAERLERYRIDHHAIRIAERTADWTLLITSGEFGDKLPIGFRGCHDAIDPDDLARRAAAPCDLRVVASLPNRLADRVLSAEGARARFFAPGMLNMTDREHPIGRFARCVDILCCNRTEWSALDDRSAVSARVPIVAVTDGPRGIDIQFTNPNGATDRIHVPAFPRARPPRDTNRAGEAFASTMVAALLDGGWNGLSRGVGEPLVRTAAERAAAAAALVLDRTEFGFPTVEEIARAVGIGRVE